MKRLLVIIWVILLATPCPGQDASVRATVDRSEVAPGESLVLTVEIKGGEGNVSVSGIRDFDVASQGSSRNISVINGRMSSSTTYTYVLLPKKTGRLLVPPLPVTVDDQTLYTQMLAIQVSEDQSGPVDGVTADLFVDISLSDASPYLGEQVVARVKIYNAITIAGRAFRQEPVFDGFTAEKMDGARSYSAMIDGRRYQVVEVVYVLVPEQTGQLSAGPAAVEFEVVSRDRRTSRSPFDAFFDTTRTVPKIIRAEAVPVTVRPLPTYSGSKPFSGLVGEFDLNVAIDETDLNVGGSANLTVTVIGRGNIREAPLPSLELPEDVFKVYQEDPVTDVAVSDAGLSGNRRFAAALVPLQQGQYKLGPFFLNYFDVEREQYITVQSEPIMVTVAPAADKDRIDLYAADNGAKDNDTTRQRKQSVQFTGKDIFPLKKDLAAIDHHPPVSIGWFAAGSGLPILLYFIAAALAGYMQKGESTAKMMARQAREALKDGRSSRSKTGDDLDALYRAVVYAVYARAGRKGESLTYQEARTLLENSGCAAALIDETANALEAIEQARYGGQADTLSPDKELLATVGSLVRRLIK